MGNPLLVRSRKSFENKQEQGWWDRVQENGHAFFALRGVKLSAAGSGGAFDLIDARSAPGTSRRQAVSILVHGVVVCGLLITGRQVAEKLPPVREIIGRPLPPYHWPTPSRAAERPGGTNGSGGHLGTEPSSAGEFARRAQMVLLHPRIPDQQEHVLPVEPTIFDPTLNEARHVIQLGLPNMKERNNSDGPGKKGGIGNNGPGDSMGTGDEDGVGDVGDGTKPGYGAYPVKCLYCPDPEYAEEARQEKLQGSVTLRVLVTKDGRAGQVKIMKGLGLGLDERAISAVRGWKFQPARDANKNAIAEWVTVEATYRLF